MGGWFQGTANASFLRRLCRVLGCAANPTLICGRSSLVWPSPTRRKCVGCLHLPCSCACGSHPMSFAAEYASGRKHFRACAQSAWLACSLSRTWSKPFLTLFSFFQGWGSMKIPLKPKKGTLFIPRLLLGLVIPSCFTLLGPA